MYLLFNERGEKIGAVKYARDCHNIVEALPNYDFLYIGAKSRMTLTGEEIKAMNKDRANGMFYKQLAKKYNVSVSTAFRLTNRK